MKFLHLLLLVLVIEEAAAQKKLPSSISQRKTKILYIQIIFTIYINIYKL